MEDVNVRKGHAIEGVVFAGCVDGHVTEDQAIADAGHLVKGVVSNDVASQTRGSAKANRECLFTRLAGAIQGWTIGHLDDVRHVTGGTRIDDDVCNVIVFRDVKHRRNEITGIQGAGLAGL